MEKNQDSSTNSSKQNDNRDDDSESDVEEIGQDVYFNQSPNDKFKPPTPQQVNQPPPTNPSHPKNRIEELISSAHNFFKNIFSLQPPTSTFSVANTHNQNQQKNNFTPAQKSIPQVQSQSKSNLTMQGQFANMSNQTFSLHPSVQVPKYYTFAYHGLNVKFPYEKPYDAQKMLISNSILAFKNGQNALLESPTGTGKSLALLSAALSYLETAPQIVKLYYTSRTHIQLQQLVNEYKKLPYFPQFSILASKRHLCIVPHVARSNSPEYECRKLCEEDGCPYSTSENGKNVFDIEDVKVKKNNPNSSVPFEFTNRGNKPKFDIDDLKEYGKKHKVCPYQLAFNIYHCAQLVFCPYNYILKANDDKNLLLDFPKDTTIAIFDEGHNIESTARDDASLILSYKQVDDTRKSLQYVPLDDSYKTLFEQVQRIQTDIINFIQNKRDEYDKNFNSFPVNSRPKYLAAESFRSVFVNTDAKLISSIGVQMANWLKVLANSDKESLERDKMFVNDIIISFFSTCSDVLLALTPLTFDFYRIVYVPDEKGDIKRDEFRLLCLKPSFLFDKINRKTRSIIISSGTLSPLESFAAELESSFPIRVSAPHVVDPSQVVTISINSYQNCRITSRYSTIQAHGDEIYSALSHIILKTLKTVPGGSLFFTPSYYSKDMIIRQWKSTDMYSEIEQIKPIVEEKSNLSAPAIIKQFTSFPDGALLIGVCRGKISEGLDFSDDLSRIVYVFGIPYPGFKEADVELKMKYNDIRHSLNKSYLSGQEWYTCQAFRALFQSVGRCLRHTCDYGAIVFLDERIDSNIEKLPNWLKANIFKNQTADQAERILSSFYKTMKEKYPSSNNFSSLGSTFNFTNQVEDQFSYESNQQYVSPKPFKMNNYQQENQYSPSRNSFNSNYTNQQYASPKPFKMNNYQQENQYSPSRNSFNSNNTNQQYASPKPFKMNNYQQEDQYSPSRNSFNSNYTNLSPSKNSNYTNFSPSRSSFNSNYSNYNSDLKFSPTIKPENKINMNNGMDTKGNFNKSFMSANNYYQQIKKEENKQSEVYEDNEYEIEKKIKEEEEKDPNLTDMYCNSCGSLLIRIKNLDYADFKTIFLPEFFQVLNTIERRTKIMYLMKSAVQTDLTKLADTITSSDFSITLTRRDCPKCGKPVGAYVVKADENNEFKKGELLFKQDMIAMKFKGKIRSLIDIATSS